MGDDLGARMKAYERASASSLKKKSPVIIRLDGKAFHTFTRGMDRPFDENLSNAMAETTEALVREIDGCVGGYTQSDEISLLLTDMQSNKSEGWFGYKMQKLVSVSASMCSVFFNRLIDSDKPAFFDARAFNLPEGEVNNYFIWRQQDAIRNAIRMVGYSNFSHKRLLGVSNPDLVRLLREVGVDIDQYETRYLRGLFVRQKRVSSTVEDMLLNVRKVDMQKFSDLVGRGLVQPKERATFRVVVQDRNMPILSEERSYVPSLLAP